MGFWKAPSTCLKLPLKSHYSAWEGTSASAGYFWRPHPSPNSSSITEMLNDNEGFSQNGTWELLQLHFSLRTSLFLGVQWPRKYAGWKSKPLPSLQRLPSACIEGRDHLCVPGPPFFCSSLNIRAIFHNDATLCGWMGRLWLGQRIHSRHPVGD